MFLPNPGILAAGVQGSNKTYDEFVAHITPMSGSLVNWDFLIGNTAAQRVLGFGDLPLSETTMEGSTWLSVFSNRSYITRAVQHAMPDEAAFNALYLSNTMLLIRTEAAGTAPAPALNKSGYQSLFRASNAVRRCTEILAWINGQPMRIQPNLGIGPEPYDW